MINFRVTDIQGGLLTIERPTGQAISLKLSEIVRAQVMEILPSGALALRIKGEPVIAKTQVPLQPGTNPYFKVTALPTEGKDLILQFIGFGPEDELSLQTKQTLQDLPRQQQLSTLIKEFQSLLGQMKDLRSEQPNKIAKLQELNAEIIKSLPEDTHKLPKELRAQLQQVLQDSLRLTGNSMQSKLAELIKSLPPQTTSLEMVENIKKDLSLSVERLVNSSLKGALQDTGVVLEAKLKNIAHGTPMPTLDTPNRPDERTTKSDTKAQPLAGLTEKGMSLAKSLSEELTTKLRPSISESPAINNDLKAKLLQLRHQIQALSESLEAGQAKVTQKAEATSMKTAESSQLLQKIDSLLKDIETFQTLSKATNSFYTFLPLDWKGLKEGTISIKKGKPKPGGLSPYSCRIDLDLQELGAVGVLVMKYGRDFYLSMKVEDKVFQAELSKDIRSLEEAFLARGMNLRSVRVFDYKDPEDLERVEELMVQEGGINLKA